MTNSPSLSAAAAVAGEEEEAVCRCQFYLQNKRRYCANSSLPNSKFCGNHDPSSKSRRIPCPIDPSHSVFIENLDSHVKRCPLKKQVEALETKTYYSKGINGGIGVSEGGNVSSEAKRRAIYEMNVGGFNELVRKIRDVHSALEVELKESFVEPDACMKWMYQQASAISREACHAAGVDHWEHGSIGILEKPIESSDCTSCEYEGEDPVEIEFGAGRGYLTHMLADCYETKKIYLVERRSYKLKAVRSLRQQENISLERLRIDIQDLDLHGIESLKGRQYLAIGKHLCGPATDMAIRCCLSKQHSIDKHLLPRSCHLQGIAIATCCHHLCQWNLYINTTFISKMGITKEDFNAITWFSSWAVDGDHSSEDQRIHLNTFREEPSDSEPKEVQTAIRNMHSAERDAIGFMCKDIIDIG